MTGLYIHVPFCKQKCIYCDFNSYAGYDELIPAYFNALEKELIFKADSFMSKNEINHNDLTSIYIGGGTPSFVDESYITRMMDIIKETFTSLEPMEITIEANPGTLTPDNLKRYHEAGINRISLGVQSLNDDILKFLGRIHSSEDFFQSIEMARKTGFENINADLIFAIPGQTKCDFERTLDSVISLDIPHISCYGLIFEEGTKLINMLRSSDIDKVDDETDREMYYIAKAMLKSAGYIHYEISNFAKPGFESRHNMLYWTESMYIGIGTGAHSFWGENGKKKRYCNVSDITKYIKLSHDSTIDENSIEEINIESEMEEYIIMGLRLTKGINYNEFKKKFKKDIFHIYSGQIKELESKGLLVTDRFGFKLSDEGLDLANKVMVEFLK